MSLKKITGWVGECDDCGENVSAYVASKKVTLQEIDDEDAFLYGSLLICWGCITFRACMIFGHPEPRIGSERCRRCARHFWPSEVTS